MKEKLKFGMMIFASLATFIFAICVINSNTTKNTLQTSANVVSSENLDNKKIGWGIKRVKDHKQPELGSRNIELLQQFEGIAMGNANTKRVYLTFDEGYEAGYTSKILDILKENDVKATFFITAHYLNTQADLVKRMVEEGHIVGNHIPKYLMS